MVISEETRHRLYQRLEEVLGHDDAATLMEHLPPVGWADVATKTDIENLRVATKTDIENLRVDIENLRAATKTDIENLRVATKTDIENLRVAIDSSVKLTRSEILGRVERELRMQTWRFITVVAAFASLAIASPHL